MAAALAVAGSVAVSFALVDGRESQGFASGGPAGTAAGRTVDVLHNPPVLFDPGKDVALDFNTVCKGVPCEGSTGAVHVSGEGGDTADLKPVRTDGATWRFVVPAELTTRPFTYRAEFQLASGRAAWPSNGGEKAVGTAVPFDGSVADVDLGEASFDPDDQQAGERVATATWGGGRDQIGIDDAGIGATSFDVTDTGALVVLDQANRRLVTTFTDGSRSATSIDLDRDFPDLTIDGDDLYVLFPNGAGSGDAYVGRYTTSGGRQLERIPATGGGAGMIRARDGRVEIFSQDSSWVPVVDHGRSVPISDQQKVASPGARVGDATVYLKHVGDHEVRVVSVRSDGSRNAWRVSSRTPLGASLLAEPRGEDVLLVQSRFTNTDSEHVVALLRSDGSYRSFNVPVAQFAETTSGSEFRLHGDWLYAYRSTRVGATFVRYPITREAFR